MATAQYERSGTRASAHPDPDPDPELRIKSPNSVPDPSVPDHRMQYLKSDVELGVRSIPVPYLFHTRFRPNKVFGTYSPCIIVGTSKRQSSFHTLRIKYAIQTLRIRQHRNVHSGHVVLISSHITTPKTSRRAKASQVSKLSKKKTLAKLCLTFVASLWRLCCVWQSWRYTWTANTHKLNDLAEVLHPCEIVLFLVLS